jgi:hypothetical protein
MQQYAADDGTRRALVDIAADLLDGAYRFMAHALPGLARGHVVVRPQVAAADAGADDADDRIGRVEDGRVGDVLDADVAGAVHDNCSHA